MALSQSVLSELLDAFRAGEGVDLVRDAVQLVTQVNRPGFCIRSSQPLRGSEDASKEGLHA